MKNTIPNIFKHGSRWIRADFHLHTIADKEFQYNVEPSYFARDYVDKLNSQDVRFGVITNHNKFDLGEYKALKANALKQEIFLLPGVELSVSEGANGIHSLLVFDGETWLSDGEDYINRFLDAAFEHGVKDRENENARCNYNIDALLKKLIMYRAEGRDSFIILAHVEDRCGFFRELKGGRIKQFAAQSEFRDFVLGFQKFRTRDIISNARDWFGGELPPFVEGSDCKCIVDVGRAHLEKGVEKKTFLKLGDFNFEAIKYALLTKETHVESDVQERKSAYIKSLHLVTSKHSSGLEIKLNAEMNNLIGIRGSGKSTVLEILRYGLGLELPESRSDREYKEGLIAEHLGSGGEIKIEIVGRGGDMYRVERIYKDKPRVFVNGQLRPNLKPDGTIETIYFGQKDLAQLGEAEYQKDLLNQLFQEAITGHQKSISDIKSNVLTLLHEVQRLDKAISGKKAVEEEIAKIGETLRLFKQHKIEEKLKRQVAFAEDVAKTDEIEAKLDEYHEALVGLREEHEQVLAQVVEYRSKENSDLFTPILAELKKLHKFFSQTEREESTTTKCVKQIQVLKQSLLKRKQGFDKEFAEVKRQIQRKDLNADVFLEQTEKRSRLKLQLADLHKKSTSRKRKVDELHRQLDLLQKSWHDEFKSLRTACDTLNGKQLPIRLTLDYKGDKKSFIKELTRVARGTGIQQKTIESVVEKFSDPIELYHAMMEQAGRNQLEELFGSPKAWASFQQKFVDSLDEILTFQVPNRPSLSYKGKEFALHSTGQRASALMLFILGREKEELMIIDQPEDDLDNQSIYEEVIKKLIQMKPRTQFIFATHNPNIPVLGECDQVIVCDLQGGTLRVDAASLDNREVQTGIITIMEGGEDAFKKRREIYELWKPMGKEKK